MIGMTAILSSFRDFHVNSRRNTHSISITFARKKNRFEKSVICGEKTKTDLFIVLRDNKCVRVGYSDAHIWRSRTHCHGRSSSSRLRRRRSRHLRDAAAAFARPGCCGRPPRGATMRTRGGETVSRSCSLSGSEGVWLGNKEEERRKEGGSPGTVTSEKKRRERRRTSRVIVKQ